MRQQYHARIAHALHECAPETAETQPELLAHHYTEAGLTESAIDCLERAGERDSQRSAHKEAVGHLRRAVTLLEQLSESAERNERELRLLAVLGVSLQASEGFSSPVANSCYERIRELCQVVEDFSPMAPALWGSFSFHVTKADLPAAQHVADELYRFGMEQDDPMAQLTGHVALSNAAFYKGHFPKALHHMDTAIGLYKPAWAKEFVSHYVQDFGSTAQCIAAWTLWCLGLEDAAAERARRGVAHARTVGHPFTLAYMLAFAGAVETMRGMRESARELAEEAITISDQYGFPLWRGVGRIIRGWCLAGQDGALEQMQEGMAIASGTRNQAAIALILGSLAEAQMAAGMQSEALQTLEGALGISQQNGANFWDAELHRLRGEAVLQLSDRTNDEAETLFRKAIDIAQGQEARAPELRAATSLARLWQHQGKKDQARAMLQPLYAWFTEGFDTRDLKDARALLEELGA
jgi:predicted ATPase